MKFNQQEISISVPKKYAKPYAQKIKNILWTRFESSAEIEDRSFDGDEEADISIYFLSTDDQYTQLIALIITYFGNILR